MIDHDVFHDVTRTVYEFAYGIDTRDWERYRRIFAAEVEFDYESYHGRPATRMTPDAWVDAVTQLFMGLDATQHSMSNPLVDVGPDGTEARCRMYMQAAHFLTHDDIADEFTIGGYYDDHLVVDETDGIWRIDAVKLTVWWRRGNADIMRLAHERTRSARRAD